MITEPSLNSNSDSVARPIVLSVRARTPTVTQVNTGFTVVSSYVEQFWQSALGPTSVALLRYLARHELPIGGEDSPYVEVSVPVARHALVVRRGFGLGGQSRSASPDLGEDLVGWLLPNERLGVVVPVFYPDLDGVDELVDAVESASA